MLRSLELKDYMSTQPVRVKPEDEILNAVQQLLAHKASGACVIDDGGYLVGVLSELDCLRAILSPIYNERPQVGKVEEFMTKEVITVNLHDNVVDVAKDMLEQSHRRRPIVDSNGLLIGQVSCRQLLSAVANFAS